MTIERWAEVRSAVEKAVDLEKGHRTAFLRELRDRDAQLFQEVEQLLAFENEASVMLPIERWQDGPRVIGESVEAGMQVGRYRLLHQIGRGGMGTVFLAERADGEYQQRVAVKLLQDNVTDRRLAERFRQERQILARLEHPNIARLLDGGVTANGTPYAVMEFVDGKPIDAFCEAEGLDIRARLGLFLLVARAVQYAHQQLVLHLDLKPANILVTRASEPRLLDFGIAKLMAGLGEGQGTAENTTRLMTPQYASPEQVMGAPLGVASDVFSLGTLLYKLLTGRLPYQLNGMVALDARVICEVEPLAPSEADPEQRAALRGDLDLILLQALRKEPERRYPTIAAFAQDVERYLDSRPVRAHRDGLGYRTRKFVRRHRTPVLSAAVVLLVLVGSVVAVVHSALLARRHQKIAEQRLHDVRDLARGYLFDLDPALQGIPGTIAVRGLILQNGLKYLDVMATDPGRDPDLDYEIARGYMKASVLQNSAIWQSQGRKKDSEASMAKAVALMEADYRRRPGDLDTVEHYLHIEITAARALEEAGDIIGYDRRLLQLWRIGQPLLSAHGHPQATFEMGALAGELATNRIGNGALWNLADPEGGIEWAKRADTLMEQLLREEPTAKQAIPARADLIFDSATLSDGAWELGDERAAIAALQRLRALAEKPDFRGDPRNAPALRVADDYTLEALLAEQRLKEAEVFAERSRPRDFREAENNSRLDIFTNTYLGLKGNLDLELGRDKLGVQESLRGLEGDEELLRKDPTDVNAQVQVVYWALRLAAEPLAPAELRERAARRVLAITGEYAERHPGVASAYARLFAAHLQLAILARMRRDLRGADAEVKEARAALASLRGSSGKARQSEFLATQLEAVASGRLDGQNACLQRVGATHFYLAMSGPQQLQACGVQAKRVLPESE